MTLLEAMTEGYLLATGKATLPAAGSAKYNRLLSLAKKIYHDWQTETGVDWNSLHRVLNIGNVTATDEFAIGTDIHKISQREEDAIRIVTDDNTHEFMLVPAPRLYRFRYGNAVAHIGANLKFSRTFAADDQEFGGAIHVPVFVKLTPLSDPADAVLIDNPNWLPAILAAHYVLSDRQLNYKYPDLIAQANDLMVGMKLANNPQSDTYNTGEDFFDVGSA